MDSISATIRPSAQVDRVVLECKIRGFELSDDDNPFIDLAFRYLDEFDYAEYQPLLAAVRGAVHLQESRADSGKAFDTS